MLVYQLFLFPQLIKRVGTKRAQRAAAIVAVSNYLVFPLLSRIHDSGPSLVASSLVLLFLENSASSAVSLARLSCLFPAPSRLHGTTLPSLRGTRWGWFLFPRPR